MKHLARTLAAALLAVCSATQAQTVDPSTVSPPPPRPQALSLAEIQELTPEEKVKAGRALWQYKCATEAGEKIYKTVPGVEGVLLMKLRPNSGDKEWSDPNWPGAAFSHEEVEGGYITSFLAFEHIRPKHRAGQRRGSISTGRTDKCDDCNLPGYRWVDAIDEKDGQRWRYVLEQKPRPTSKIGWVDTVLAKTPAPNPPPRYGVTFEDHVVPEERALGVASSTIKVLDLQSNEVLGELTRYAVAGAIGKYNPTLWLTAYVCPYGKGQAGSEARKLTDQILIPIDQEK